MELYKGFDSNYRYILVAARRARQIQSGAQPLVDTPSRKPCRIAEQEIQADKIKWSLTGKAAEAAEEQAAEAAQPESEE